MTTHRAACFVLDNPAMDTPQVILKMKARRIPPTETSGYCHDCHNRARLEVTFSHRAPIRLCDRCGRFLIANVGEVVKRNGNNKTKKQTPVGG